MHLSLYNFHSDFRSNEDFMQELGSIQSVNVQKYIQSTVSLKALIPKAVMKHIFSFLNVSDCSVLLSCKEWKNLSLKPIKNSFIEDYMRMIELAKKEGLTPSVDVENKESLSLKDLIEKLCDELTSLFFDLSKEKLKKLKETHLNDNNHPFSKIFESIRLYKIGISSNDTSTIEIVVRELILNFKKYDKAIMILHQASVWQLDDRFDILIRILKEIPTESEKSNLLGTLKPELQKIIYKKLNKLSFEVSLL